MDVYKLIYPDNNDVTRTIAKVSNGENASLEVGAARILTNRRIPDEGFSCHPHTEISVILEGVLDVVSGGKMHRLVAGDLVVVPAGEPHYTVALEDTRLMYAFFGDESS